MGGQIVERRQSQAMIRSWIGGRLTSSALDAAPQPLGAKSSKAGSLIPSVSPFVSPSLPFIPWIKTRLLDPFFFPSLQILSVNQKEKFLSSNRSIFVLN